MVGLDKWQVLHCKISNIFLPPVQMMCCLDTKCNFVMLLMVYKTYENMQQIMCCS